MANTRGPIEGILTDALNLISGKGRWIKGEYDAPCNDGGTCYCTVGAINGTRAALEQEDEAMAVFLEANPGISRASHDAFPESKIIDWNDRKRRRKHEVVKAFQKAIAYARERRL